MHKPHKTAISRKKLSTPMKYLQKNLLLSGKMLDYGSGRGNDAQLLGMEKYDPYFQPTYPYGQQFDTITCNYVLNVCNELERGLIITRIKNLLTTKGKAYISVRNDLKMPEQVGNGCIQYQVDIPYEIVKKTSNYKMYLVTK